VEARHLEKVQFPAGPSSNMPRSRAIQESESRHAKSPVEDFGCSAIDILILDPLYRIPAAGPRGLKAAIP
jgi:hypothetical protein